jgi:hypothetical protein
MRISSEIKDMLAHPYKGKRYKYRRDEHAEPEEGKKCDDEWTVEKDGSDAEEEEKECGWSCDGVKDGHNDRRDVTILNTYA